MQASYEQQQAEWDCFVAFDIGRSWHFDNCSVVQASPSCFLGIDVMTFADDPACAFALVLAAYLVSPCWERQGYRSAYYSAGPAESSAGVAGS